ncbi:MAG: RcnB family protein [Phenylobacterium sp.]
MKTKIAALSLLLLASTATEGLAQERGSREPRAERSRADGPRRAPDAPRAQQPRPAPGAPQATAPGEGRRGGNGFSEGRRSGGDGERRGDGNRGDGQRTDGNRGDGRGDRDRGSWNGGDRRGDRGDRRGDNDRRGGDWNRGDNDRWRGDNRDNHGRPRWDQNRYPPVYRSQNRYRGHSWRAPSGFYSRLWVYGDILPRGWYGSNYQLNDWWSYGLPMPPPGYDWVRVGDDAILIDSYSGRVVQVVRYVFW